MYQTFQYRVRDGSKKNNLKNLSLKGANSSGEPEKRKEHLVGFLLMFEI